MTRRGWFVSVALMLAAGVAVVLATSAPRSQPPRANSQPRAGSAIMPMRRPPSVAPDALPLAEGDAAAEITRAQHAIDAHGRRCWEQRIPVARGAGAPDETMGSLRLHLRVVVAGGAGQVDVLGVTNERQLDSALRACLVDRLAELRWSTSGPSGTAELHTLVRVGAFTVPTGPPAGAAGLGIVPPEARVPPPPEAQP